MNDKLIYVLVCTYQGEEFISRQLDSILAQTYPYIEIHVFDDCSSDNTLGSVKGYCLKHDNLFIHENKNNIGFLKNFEKAIGKTKGKYIALCDQDDIWDPKKIEISMKQMEILEKKFPNTPALIHTDLTFIDGDENILAPSFFIKKGINLDSNKSLNQMLGHCGVMGNTILMNRLLVEKVLPFPSGLKYHDYWISLINELFGVRKTIHQSLVGYRLHDKNVSNNNMNFRKVWGLGFLNRDYQLPFMEDKRECVMRHLLDNYSLEADDKIIIEKFEKYLMSNGNKLSYFSFLIRSGLLKSGFLYRISVFFRILLTRRYIGKATNE